MANISFGLGVPTDVEFADPARLVALAQDAEAAGWDGFFVWDHLVRRPPWEPIVDPWIVLGAVAQATERLRIGPVVTPLPRRRPAKVARETATLDRLSGGRLILGVGLGTPDDEYARFGEDPDPRVRAQKLDESLDILAGLWTGDPFSYNGEHHLVDDVRFEPTPLQQPRVPIWVAGRWPARAPFRRAARWDGVYPIHRDVPRGHMLSVDQLREVVEFTLEQRGSAEGFDVALHGISDPAEPERTAERVGRYADVGLTWWNELLERPGASFAQMRERVLAGPPRL